MIHVQSREPRVPRKGAASFGLAKKPRPFAGPTRGRAFPSRESSDLNYRSRTHAFGSRAHKFGLHAPLVRLSFARKGVSKSRRLCRFNKTSKVGLFRAHSAFYQSYCSGLLRRPVPALTSLASKSTSLVRRRRTRGMKGNRGREGRREHRRLVNYP